MASVFFLNKYMFFSFEVRSRKLPHNTGNVKIGYIINYPNIIYSLIQANKETGNKREPGQKDITH